MKRVMEVKEAMVCMNRDVSTRSLLLTTSAGTRHENIDSNTMDNIALCQWYHHVHT